MTFTIKKLMFCLISLCCAITIFTLDMSGMINPLHRKAYDAIFCLKTDIGRTWDWNKP